MLFRPRKKRTSSTASLLPPTKGWWPGQNAADSAPGTALVVDNFFPQENKMRLRRGCGGYASGGLSAPVETMFTFESGAVERLFLVKGGSIYDATAPGTLAAPGVTGLNKSRCETAQFATSGGTFLMLVNGIDKLRRYDGTTWFTDPGVAGSVPAITGFDSATFSDVWSYQNRLWFVIKGTTDACYLPVDSIGGSAARFPLGGVFQKGGSLLAGATWSPEDAGRGQDDKIVFLSSNGEVAIYRGTNPAATDGSFSLDGVFQIGKPLGTRCFLKTGGDLAIMTEQGLVPLSQAIQLSEEALTQAAVSRPIQPEWTVAVQRLEGLDGWQVTLWPRESMAIISQPVPDGEAGQQFVANIRTGAWCRYTGWPATTFCVSRNRLFYGLKTGEVIEGEIGGNDRGAAFSGMLVWPFDGFKDAASFKVAQIARPMMEGRTPIEPRVSVLADYVLQVPPPPSTSAALVTGSQWDVAQWDQALWPGASVAYTDWQAVTGAGSALATVLQVTVDTDITPDIYLSRLDLVYQRGEVMT